MRCAISLDTQSVDKLYFVTFISYRISAPRRYHDKNNAGVDRRSTLQCHRPPAADTCRASIQTALSANRSVPGAARTLRRARAYQVVQDAAFGGWMELSAALAERCQLQLEGAYCSSDARELGRSPSTRTLMPAQSEAGRSRNCNRRATAGSGMSSALQWRMNARRSRWPCRSSGIRWVGVPGGGSRPDFQEADGFHVQRPSIQRVHRCALVLPAWGIRMC